MKSLTLGTLGLALISAATPASANGADFALGMVGGMVGMAMAQQHPYYVAYPYRTRHYHHARAVQVRGPATPVASMTLPRDRAQVVRFFMNCKTGNDTTTAKAENGYITSRRSTRYVCGDPDHDVTEFVYLSRPGFVGADQVTYYSNGRPIRYDKIYVNDSAPPVRASANPTRVTTGLERIVWSFWDCNPSGWNVAVTASAGVGAVRVQTSAAAVCGRSDYPIKQVFYRSSDNYAGADVVTMKSSNAAPIIASVMVDKAVASVAPAPKLPPVPTASASPGGAPEAEKVRAVEATSASTCTCEDLDFEGSRTHSQIEGIKVSIKYVSPRLELASSGVVPGSSVFEGSLLPNGGMGGLAYAYKAGCGPASYPVIGRPENGELVLWAMKSEWKGCELSRSSTETDASVKLVFTQATSASPQLHADAVGGARANPSDGDVGSRASIVTAQAQPSQSSDLKQSTTDEDRKKAFYADIYNKLR